MENVSDVFIKKPLELFRLDMDKIDHDDIIIPQNDAPIVHDEDYEEYCAKQKLYFSFEKE
jgi:hypothetical protein